MLGKTNSSDVNVEDKKQNVELDTEGGMADTVDGEVEMEKGKLKDESTTGVENGNPKNDGDEPNVSEEAEADSVTSADKSKSIEPESRVLNADMEKALAAERDRYLRLAAEYDNFRKRSAKEREKIYNDARADTVTRLLPVYDNLERALKMVCSDEAFYKGVDMTMTQLTEIFANMDIKLIQAQGEPFDPNRHNAVMTIEDPELGEKVVAQEFQKGFTLGERVIRHSTVVVAN